LELTAHKRQIADFIRVFMHHIGDAHQPLHAINVLDMEALSPERRDYFDALGLELGAIQAEI